MSFTNNGSKLTGKSITNSFNVVADNITVEKNELIKGNLTVLGTSNIASINIDGATVNNLAANNLSVINFTANPPVPISSGGTGLSTLGLANQALVVNSTATALEYKPFFLFNPSQIVGTGFTGTPTFNFGIEASGPTDGRGFIRTSAAATELVLGTTTSNVLRLSGSGGSANFSYNSAGTSGIFDVTNAGGAITFTNSNAGTISMATAGGSITLGPVSLLTPAVNINTAGGIFNLSTGAGQMDIVTVLGVMNIGTGGGPLNISTGVGNLSITATTGILSLTTAAAGAVNLGATGLGLVNLYGSALTISSGAVNLLSGAWTGQTGLWNITTLAFGLQTASCNISSLASITLQTLVGTIILNGTNTTMNGPTTITASTTPLQMTVTGSLQAYVFTCYQADLGNSAFPIQFGKSAATNLSAVIRFSNDNTVPANNFLGLGFFNNNDLYRIVVEGSHIWRNTTAETMALTSAGKLTVSGTNTLTNSGVLNVNNAHTGSASAANFFAPSLGSGNFVSIAVGRQDAASQGAYLNFLYNTTATSVSSTWGFAFATPSNSITLNGNGTNTITGSTTIIGNLGAQNVNSGILEINSNTALTVNSPKIILVRGGPTITITLPNATTLDLGWNYIINNDSNHTVTINTFTSTLLTNVLSGQLANVYLLTNPNTAGTWDYHLAGSVNSVTAISPIIVTGTVDPVISISSTAAISLGPLTVTANHSGYTIPSLAVSSSTATAGSIANFLAPSLNNSAEIALGIGKSATLGNMGTIGFIPGSSNGLGELVLGINALGTPKIKLQYLAALSPQITIEAGGSFTVNTTGNCTLNGTTSTTITGGPLIAKGTVSGSPSANGVYSGVETNGNTSLQLNSPANQVSVIDFGSPNVDFNTRILGDNSLLKFTYIAAGGHEFAYNNSPGSKTFAVVSSNLSAGFQMQFFLGTANSTDLSTRLSFQPGPYVGRKHAFGIGITGHPDVFSIWGSAGGNQIGMGDLDVIPTTPNGIVNISNRAGNNQVMTFYFGSSAVGSIVVSAGGTAFNSSSDYRLKSNVVPMTNTIDKILSLNPVEYNYGNNPDKYYGFLAHELKEIIPIAVTGEKDAVRDDGEPIYQGVDYSKLTPYLTAAFKDLYSLVQTLQARITVLESQ